MMSGSTVLKNSAQLCSQKQKLIKNGGKTCGNTFPCLIEASVPAGAASPAWSTGSGSPRCWHRTGAWTRCEWRAPFHPAAAPSTRSESQGLCQLLGRFLERKELNSAFAVHPVWSTSYTKRYNVWCLMRMAKRKKETHLFFLHTRCQSWAPWVGQSSATHPLQDDLSNLSIPHPPHTDTRTPKRK